jgi:hypothetical protein
LKQKKIKKMDMGVSKRSDNDLFRRLAELLDTTQKRSMYLFVGCMISGLGIFALRSFVRRSKKRRPSMELLMAKNLDFSVVLKDRLDPSLSPADNSLRFLRDLLCRQNMRPDDRLCLLYVVDSLRKPPENLFVPRVLLEPGKDFEDEDANDGVNSSVFEWLLADFTRTRSSASFVLSQTVHQRHTTPLNCAPAHSYSAPPANHNPDGCIELLPDSSDSPDIGAARRAEEGSSVIAHLGCTDQDMSSPSSRLSSAPFRLLAPPPLHFSHSRANRSFGNGILFECQVHSTHSPAASSLAAECASSQRNRTEIHRRVC